MGSKTAFGGSSFGDGAASMAEAYAEHRDALKRYLLSRLRCPETAEDLTQETWIRIARAADPEDAISNPRAYLFRIATNLAIDHQRKERRRLLSMAEVDAMLEPADQQPGPAQIAEGRSEFFALKRVLKDLPEQRRRMLIMARVDRLTHAEIARIFGVSTRTVQKEIKLALEFAMTRMSRAGSKS